VNQIAVRDFARSQGIESVEGSAKLGQNTTDAFEEMGELMLSTSSNAGPALVIEADDPKKKQKGKCC
jgi:hypothetical protein